MSVLGGGDRSAGRSRGRSAKFELIFTTRCQYGGRSARFELILTTRCQYWGVDLQNLSSQTFRCGHHRGLFVLHMKDQLLLNNFQCNCLQEINSCFGGSISQSRFICQVWCSGIQGISALLPRGVQLPKYVGLPSFVYWYSRHLCFINGGSIGQRRFVCQI